MVKNLPANAGDARDGHSVPGQEDPLEKDMANHSSIIDRKILMDRGPWQATVHEVGKVSDTS